MLSVRDAGKLEEARFILEHGINRRKPVIKYTEINQE